VKWKRLVPQVRALLFGANLGGEILAFPSFIALALGADMDGLPTQAFIGLSGAILLLRRV